MDILVISWNFPPRRGGIESLVRGLVAALKKRHSVSVITAYAQSSSAADIDVYRAPWPGLLPFVFYALWRGALLLARNRGLFVVFGGSAMVTPLILVLARLFGRTAVVQVHGLDILYHSPLYQFLCIRWLRSCDRIVCNSSYTASLAEAKSVLDNRISVIPPGVEPERFTAPKDLGEIKRAFGLEGRRIILFVGRLAKRKGVKEFIDKSFVEIAKKIPDVCFVIVGDSPSQALTHCHDTLGEIRAVVLKLGLQEHVRILGSLEDDEVVKLYQLCDVVVLPVLASADDVEGFGIVLLEAGAAGKPAVATRVGGIPDAIEDGRTGILVEAADYSQLTEGIIALLKSDQLKRNMGQRAALRVQEKFCWQKVSTQYEVAFELSVSDHN
jgi:phosphatidylinositol alpha-1,6-mannosyltransferase